LHERVGIEERVVVYLHGVAIVVIWLFSQVDLTVFDRRFASLAGIRVVAQNEEERSKVSPELIGVADLLASNVRQFMYKGE
jgi:hypothetical protein